MKNQNTPKKLLGKSLVLSLILWAFLPIRVCSTALGDWGRVTYYFKINEATQCHWTTVGLGIFKEWYVFGVSDAMFMVIITIVFLVVFFLISLGLVKLFYYFKTRK